MQHEDRKLDLGDFAQAHDGDIELRSALLFVAVTQGSGHDGGGELGADGRFGSFCLAGLDSPEAKPGLLFAERADPLFRRDGGVIWKAVVAHGVSSALECFFEDLCLEDLEPLGIALNLAMVANSERMLPGVMSARCFCAIADAGVGRLGGI